jgi:hypothetical protein
MHCIVLWQLLYTITHDLLFNWVGIFLYIVIANKFLTNKIKTNAQS